ncbi:uncharacterized protein THITE_119498 [Thermothielavioides terrestris NRRL 8126]|uniref:Serine/threonine-protein kinase MEC1 n=1 Tax=Thermothielavioides terrestris (strain ATCC 38088 / NRRL 8126) TaxID=578455 RepID=G2R0Z5_THETT|nr:uncharacterized protein THITE_119498 [Thermothielavioides terrestris NRRL 8126]AEO65689.1 hypothetical protein THITE_119498 [Thermothielavioides terrestris NRRL 8126]
MSIVGVNGVGKSTNLSKICFFLLQNQYKVLIAAGDTFRSGAVEQLAVHVRNLKELTAREGGQVELYQKGYGKDAATVAKDAVAFATQEGFDVVLIDTAGRRHNDQRLMSSLEKFAKFAQPDKILMVGESNNHNNNLNPAAAPPPSTLAAQLVENISASARTTTSSSDETADELRRLFATIERVKDDPACLRTPADRLAHNHLLVYVCGAVVLDGLPLADAFADAERLRADARRAVAFLRVTVAETPAVLECVTDGGTFLARGREPLWVWILPRLLRMLGHRRCAGVEGEVEELCRFVLLLAARNAKLWGLGRAVMGYFRANFSAILARLKSALSSSRERSIETKLPPQAVLEALPGGPPRGCSFALPDADHALRHALSLLTILKGVVLSPESPAALLYGQNLVWLLDALQSLSSILATWPTPLGAGLAAVVQVALDLAQAPSSSCGLDEMLYHKATTTLALRAVLLLRDATVRPLPAQPSAETVPAMFVDGELRQHVQKFATRQKSDVPRGPVAKRRRVDDETPSVLLEVANQLCRLIDADPSSEIEELEAYIVDRFPQMDEKHQCHLINLISRIPCAADDTLKRRRTEPSGPSAFHCPFCSEEKPSELPPSSRHDAAKALGIAIFCRLIKLPSFLESKRPRVFAMVALRRIARHSTDSEFWDLEKSGPGQWCLQSLQSSIRELRIAAGRALSVFISEPPAAGFDWEVLKRNRANVLSILKSLSDRGVANLHETCIMAWGQVGRVVSADELNLVLIKLVEYLGHRNMLVSGIAFNELLNLADFRGETTAQLFQPFWASLAFSVVKDLVSKPHAARLVADLMQMNVPGLLVMLQTHALPWLVLTKKREVVQKIAEARGDTDTLQTCMDPANLSAILALLLIQDAPDIAAHAMSLLGHACPQLEGYELVDLLRTNPLMIALELFKAGAQADETRKARVRTALATMANLLLVDQKDKRKKSHVLGRYFQQHALGLTARLSEVINDTWQSNPPVSEQRRCLGALEEMIRICNSYVCIARPQISACLISAMSSDELRSAAFSCWDAMLTHMEEADVEALIETTFFIIGTYWKSFDPATKKKAKNLISTLLNDYPRVFTEYSNKLPSLSHVDELRDICQALDTLRKPIDSMGAFAVFAERLNHENPGVVEQALVELIAFLEKNQDHLQTSAISEQPDPVVTTLARSLLDCSAKYNGWHADIARLCAQAVGLVGCLDSNRLETEREQKQFVVIHNFEDARETTDFVAFLLENVLVKAFLSTTDTRFLGFLSFAMQELLARTDFKAACAHQGQGDTEPLYRKWLTFSESTREVLTPFLSSRFVVAPMTYQATEYPIFKPKRSYAVWLRAFVLDLLRNGQNVFSQAVFEPLCRLIKVQDLAVAEFLMPYAVLHVIVGQEHKDEYRDKVSAEMAAILKHQPPETASYVEKEEMKQFYQRTCNTSPWTSRPSTTAKPAGGQQRRRDVLLNYVEGMTVNTVNRIAPFAVEASWATGRWQTLEKYLRLYNAGDVSEVFNLGVGQALLCLKDGNVEKFKEHIQMLRDKVAGSMTYSATSSLRACHDAMLKCHVLSDLEMIANENLKGDGDQQGVLAALDRRLEVLGAYVSDKQYLLGIRRAAMELMRARLARKSGSMHQSFNAVLHAQQLGDGSAMIENARLLYKDGHHRKAIQILQHAISTNSFISENAVTISVPPTSSKGPETQRNMLTARAHLLLAKWLDSTGQTHASALRSQYQQAAKTYPQWEKGHYYLGRHYKKVLESEKALEPDDQTDEYLTGETAKLVIENYLRSLNFGAKYLPQTLPRILTLFLELGAQVDKAPTGKVSLSRELHMRRKAILHELYKNFQKHLSRMPAYIFYTSLPQIVARIAHPNPEVFKVLEQMILKVVEAHPRQAIWNLFPLMTTRQAGERRTRGLQILQAARGISKKVDGTSLDLKMLLRMGEKLAEQLLLACTNGDFQSNRTTMASITRDLNFNHNCTPCPLVVPVEACLTATLPTLTDNVRKHKAFSRDVITIDSFLDQVLVLGSLAKPRKLTARGTDGKLYGLLIKPKDDLRTDQRLMEFNGLINRSLKRDAESSRRQLYIRTYAVTPLNEECGIIEWVDGLKTLRDILLAIYKTRNIQPNYSEIAQKMKQAAQSDANTRIFTEDVLGQFPPVLPDWFIAQFPNPSAWFAARLKYTRSCAVMSMVGTILGLGDRHGENVLLEEGNGGIFHVDFNCLFDKGLTFAQPERVPFRLTHNMEAAMGFHRYEGPFRHCSELTLRILRQQEETLMTILEAFIYDPTLDLQRTKKRHYDVVRMNPTAVVESIRRKVRGLLPEESIPLGVSTSSSGWEYLSISDEMSYRIEISPNNRAGCQDKVCKDAKSKIPKGELRLGTWVEIQDHGGWRWKHWGCVSGEQVVNMQEKLGVDKNGEYNWDMLDGWEELEDHPDLRQKVMRVIKQGHIDPEDFKGDPAYNKPGQKGIRPRAKKPKADDEATEAEDTETEAKAKPKKAAAKRGRKKVENDDEEAEPEPPAKKSKRGGKKKPEPEPEPEAEPEPEPEKEKPKKAAKGKRGAKAAAAVKEESEAEPEPEPEPEVPKKKAGRAKKGKKEPSPEPEAEEGEKEAEPEPKARAGRRAKAAEKKEAAPPAKKRGRKS